MNRRVLTIILAVLLAVLGTTAVLFYVNRADARALDGQRAVSVLIATKPIPAGTTARAAKSALSVETMPAASVPPDVLSGIDKDLSELVTSTDIAQGQLLTRRLLVEESKKNAIVLPEGKLAVTIPVEPGSLGEVPLEAGFKVAVFDTFAAGDKSPFTPATGTADSDVANQATRLLLPKVEVISVVASKAKSKAEGGSTKSSGFDKHLVTVAVTQSEAERLIHVLRTGTVSLALVNDESKVTPNGGVDTKHLFPSGS